MIYEMRTYTLKPNCVNEFEKRFAEALPHREKYSKLAAFWHTEIGPLNQVIHLWPYEDLNERTRLRAEAAKDPHWPPKVHDLIETMETKILIPAAFSPLQ
ncbi:MAG: NIPSNAP family protein [Dehalococcoidia bacterium]